MQVFRFASQSGQRGTSLARWIARAGRSGIRRRIEFDRQTWNALDRLAKDRMATVQELADEAFRDLLKKHRRPTTLKEMLRESVRSHRVTRPA
jgi:predicted DNA-binding ribbon-helix-helix protein